MALGLASCTLHTGVDPPDPPPWGVPISGGTVTVTRDGTRAIVADPDRDRVVSLDLASEQVLDIVELAPGSEPGRVIEDGAGRIHVALRGSGELLTLTGGDRDWRAVCAEPRGLAWQASDDLVHVACATGELVTLPGGGGAPVRVLRLDRDLRDVVVRGTGLAVTTFRSAQVLELDAQGTVVARVQPPITHRDLHDAVPSVAWRTIALPDGRLVMSHQRRVAAKLKTQPGGYGVSCGSGPVESALTFLGTDDVPFAMAPIVRGSLPVDLAVAPTDGSIAVVSAGQHSVFVVAKSTQGSPDNDQCGAPAPAQVIDDQLGAPTSVAYGPGGALVVFYPEPSAIVIHDRSGARRVSLGGTPRNDPGRALFHQQTPLGIACASCHPEARDDGGVWTFEGLGARRTQNLAGGILARAPYHWGGDMPTLHTLVEDVFSQRMAAGEVVPEDERALGAWLDRVPAPRGVIVDSAAVVRGEELFMAPEQGCVGCHTGPLYTNKQLADVGTNSVVKVPSLIGVGARAPFLHDGCAATLRDRFGACGGGDLHGHTSQLGDAELADLVAYLESL